MQIRARRTMTVITCTKTALKAQRQQIRKNTKWCTQRNVNQYLYRSRCTVKTISLQSCISATRPLCWTTFSSFSTTTSTTHHMEHKTSRTAHTQQPNLTFCILTPIEYRYTESRSVRRVSHMLKCAFTHWVGGAAARQSSRVRIRPNSWLDSVAVAFWWQHSLCLTKLEASTRTHFRAGSPVRAAFLATDPPLGWPFQYRFRWMPVATFWWLLQKNMQTFLSVSFMSR